jgi:hypothetical protein
MWKRTVSMIAVAICLTSLICGCTINLVPSKIPPLDTETEGLAGPFNNITVSIVNAHSDEDKISVKNVKGYETGWVLSRKLWTEKLLEALCAELKARQAKVVSAAPVSISLDIMEVTYTGNTFMMTVIQYSVKANVTSNSGWTKTYVGSDAASAWVPAGVLEDSNWNRAANWAIRSVVLAIMTDPEFIAALDQKK